VAALEFLFNPWATRPRPFGILWQVRLENGLLQSTFLYIGILTTSYMLDARERLVRRDAEAAQLSDQLAQARLRALQQQIEPHFLFNALNAVAALVREQRPTAAVRAIAGLSDCLRAVLRESDRHVVTLRDELRFVEKYLDLQKLRFGDALCVTTDVPIDLLDCHVPNLVLQPIVDNAVKHGIARRVGGGAIEIGAVRAHDTLTLTVYNDGPGLATAAPDPSPNSGIGLANLRARLGMVYGTSFQLRIENVRNGVSVAMSLPLKSPSPTH
jgi:LytS/YehU family sensor histidine kinase